MAIVLDTLMTGLQGWRTDVESHNEAILYECLQAAARAVACRTHTLREFVAFVQPQDIATVNPYRNVSGKECLRIFAIRTDPEDWEAHRWLHETAGHRVPRIQDPDVISYGEPTLFVPIPGGAVLNAATRTDIPLAAMASYVLPRDTDTWPFLASAEEAIETLALSMLLERPGKGRDIRLAGQKRLQASAMMTNLYNQTIAGFAQGDYRFGVPMPAMPVSVPDDSGGGTYPGGYA